MLMGLIFTSACARRYPPSYGLFLGAALCRVLAEGAGADGG